MASFFAEMGVWIAIISGWISIVFVALWILLRPTSDKRFKSGHKDNATSPGCLLPTIGIIAGFLSYFINEMSFMDHVFGLLE